MVAGISIYGQLQEEAWPGGDNSSYCSYPQTFTLPYYRGMILDEGAGPAGSPALVVVTRDIHGPVKVYDCRGRLRQSLGAGVWELATGAR